MQKNKQIDKQTIIHNTYQNGYKMQLWNKQKNTSLISWLQDQKNYWQHEKKTQHKPNIHAKQLCNVETTKTRKSRAFAHAIPIKPGQRIQQ